MRQAFGSLGPMGCKTAAMTKKTRHVAGLDMRCYAVAADISLFFTSTKSILRWNIPINRWSVFAFRLLITVAPNTASSFPHFSGRPNTAIGDASVAVAIRHMMVLMDAMLIDQNPGSSVELSAAGLSTRKSSRLAPASIFSFSHPGCFPRPAHVFSGFCGS